MVMPELPEVETIKRGLAHRIINKKIATVWIEPSFYKRVSPSPAKFIQILNGCQFKSVKRRAKLLIFKVNNNVFMLNHLKMTGQLIYIAPTGQAVSGGHAHSGKLFPNKFNRAIFSFNDGSKLYFNDLRKFGYLKIVNGVELKQELSKYGIEPMDAKFNFQRFNELLKRKLNQKIKVFLLDQSLIAGLGNIYADESCFAAKIKPMRMIKTLNLKERMELFWQIKKTLKKAIKFKGTSVNTYVNSEGTKGGFINFLKVYGRAPAKCLRCKKANIVKIKVGERGTSYCPNCQK